MKQRRHPIKLTYGNRITLAALSLLGFVGGWNMIARLEKSAAQVNDIPPVPFPVPTLRAAALSRPLWPTIPPLAELPPIPTLVPTRTILDRAPDMLETSGAASQVSLEIVPLPALPTLAPLPSMPPLPPPPPAAPPPPQNFSGGS